MSQTQRQIRDLELERVLSNPAQNTYADSEFLDLVLAGNVALETMELVIEADAAPELVTGQTLTITLYDSADNVTYAVIDQLDTLVLTGGGPKGAAAATDRHKLPSVFRRYVRFRIAASATAGDNTAVGVKMYLTA